MSLSARAIALAGLVSPIRARSVAVDGLAVTVGYIVQIPPGRRSLAAAHVQWSVQEIGTTWTVVEAVSDRGVVMAVDAARTVSVDGGVRVITSVDVARLSREPDTARRVEDLMNIYRGNTRPAFSATLLTAGKPQDLTHATGAVLEIDQGSAATVTKTLTISATPTDGGVSYQWTSAAETNALLAGVWRYLITVTFDDGSTESWPDPTTAAQIGIYDRPVG